LKDYVGTDEAFRIKATIVHECEGHVWQQIRDGWWTWMWRYVFDTRCCEGDAIAAEIGVGWRAVYEAEAYGISAHVWVKNNRLESAVIERAAFKIRERKYPRFWFGKPPSEEASLTLVWHFYDEAF
jgi:hypothetical protein